MRTGVGNGLTIDRYIPPQLRNTFYKNSISKYGKFNGLDPYGFPTRGLALYLPLWALKGSGFYSVDAYRHICTATGAPWNLKSRAFDGDDRIVIPSTSTVFNFTSGDFSGIARVSFNSGVGIDAIISRGAYQVNGWSFNLWTEGRIEFDTDQAGTNQFTYSATGLFSFGDWVTLGFSRNGTAATLYINGATVSQTSGTHTDPLTADRELAIGQSSTNHAASLDADIETLLISDVALTTAEHLLAHNILKWRQ